MKYQLKIYSWLNGCSKTFEFDTEPTEKELLDCMKTIPDIDRYAEAILYGPVEMPGLISRVPKTKLRVIRKCNDLLYGLREEYVRELRRQEQARAWAVEDDARRKAAQLSMKTQIERELKQNRMKELFISIRRAGYFSDRLLLMASNTDDAETMQRCYDLHKMWDDLASMLNKKYIDMSNFGGWNPKENHQFDDLELPDFAAEFDRMMDSKTALEDRVQSERKRLGL